MSEQLYKEANERWLDWVQSDDAVLEKKAISAVNDYTKTRFREQSFVDRVLAPQPITGAELDRRADTDQPYKIIDKEPENPPAIAVGFNSAPDGYYIRAPRYELAFHRIATPKFSKDIDLLHTYHMDVRQVVSDNAIKDMATQKDGGVIQAINVALGATATTGLNPNYTLPATGAVQYRSFAGGISRDGCIEGKKLMMQTPFNLRPAVAVCNQVTAADFEKWDRNEGGGDISQELATKGWTEREWLGTQFIVTIKRDLVPDGRIYWFAAPDFLGKNFVLTEPTLHVKREAFYLEMFAWMTIAVGFGNLAGLAISDHV